MSRPITKGSADQSTVIRIVDSFDGTPETGVTSATSGLDLKYRREGAAAVSLTESDLAAVDSAHSDGGMIHIGAGYYRVDLPDAAVATGVDGVLIFGTVTGMVVIGAFHRLVDFNLSGQSAIDLKDFADAGYDPDTNKVAGVVLADTVTTLTNAPSDSAGITTLLTRIVGTLAAGTHNAQSGDGYAIVNNGTFGLAALKILIDTVATYVDTEVAAIKAKTDNLPASPAAAGDAMSLTAGAVDAIHDDVVEGSLTHRQITRLLLAALCGKLSGVLTNAPKFRDVADSKDRISATTTSDGRTAVTLDGT